MLKHLVLLLCLVVTPTLVRASTPVHPISPELGLEMLVDGNMRFASGEAIHPNTSISRRLVTTTNGQAPFATVIACSDSRVPVEILFDQGIGDLFVVKVAGNVADVDEIGSMEYGVDHLGTPVLMVLGHTHCGAVTAVATGAEVHGSIPQLVDNILPAVERAKVKAPNADTNDLITSAITENVWEAIASILTNSHGIAERAAEGKVVVIGAVYDIMTGKVTLMGTHPDQAALLHGADKAVSIAPAEAVQTQAPAEKAAATQDEGELHGEHAPAHDAAEAGETHGPAADPHGEEVHGDAGHGESTGGPGMAGILLFIAALIGTVVYMDKGMWK